MSPNGAPSFKELLRDWDAYRQAIAKRGHEGTPHDRDLPGGHDAEVQDHEVWNGTHCIRCASMEYGTEAQLAGDFDRLREVFR